MTKEDQLSKANTTFLRKFASELNGDYFGSYRDYSNHSRSELLSLLKRKLSVNDVNLVLNHYYLCHTPAEAASAITPDGVNDMNEALESWYSRDALYEVKIGSKYCDLVFPDDNVAIEVKSARDKIRRANSQTNHYSKWANAVYLAYDSILKDKIPNELWENGVGLLEYSEGSITEVKPARFQDPETSTLLRFMTLEYLQEMARSVGCLISGPKTELVSRLEEKLSDESIHRYFKDYLEIRGSRQIGHEVRAN